MVRHSLCVTCVSTEPHSTIQTSTIRMKTPVKSDAGALRETQQYGIVLTTNQGVARSSRAGCTSRINELGRPFWTPFSYFGCLWCAKSSFAAGCLAVDSSFYVGLHAACDVRVNVQGEFSRTVAEFLVLTTTNLVAQTRLRC